MTSRPSEFRLFDRGSKEAILLIPGWATDYRIFSRVDLNFNYLMPVRFSPFDFEDDLIAAMDKNGIRRISMLGWSMGGYMVADFVSRHPERSGDRVCIIGAGGTYDPRTLDGTKALLKKNKMAYLYKFYLKCFAENDRKALAWFRASLLKKYIDKMELDTLIEGLDYLSGAHLKLAGLKDRDIKFIRGSEDVIAPPDPQKQSIVVKGAGHAGILWHIPSLKIF